MKLYEINQQLENLLNNIDEETGEVLIDPEALDALLMERDEKIEHIALAIKNMVAEAAMIKAEETTLAERRRRLEKRTEGARDYLQRCLGGEKFQTAKVAISYRSAKSVEINEVKFWEHPADAYVRITQAPDKSAIRKALEEGKTVPGAEIVMKQSMNIK